MYYHYGGACWSITYLLTLPISLSLTSGKKYCIMYFFPYDAEAVSEMEVCFSQTPITA